MPIPRFPRLISLLLLLTVAVCPGVWGAVDFDGVDDYATRADPISTTSFITICAWVYYDTQDTDDYIYATDDLTSNTGIAILRDDVDSVTSNTDCFTVLIDSASDYRVSTASNTALAGQWIHFCLQFSGSTAGDDTIRIYLNGVYSNGNMSGAGQYGAETNAFISAPTATAGNNYADGKMSEFAIWAGTDRDSVLTNNQMYILANAKVKGMPLQINPHRLKVYLPMNDGPFGDSADGDSLSDMSHNGNSFTANDGANNTGCTWAGETVLSHPGDE